jgi:hypothetical protein
VKTFLGLRAAALVALALLSLSPGVAGAAHGVCIQGSSPAVAARFSGLSLTTLPGSSGGKGVYLQLMQMGIAANTVGARITTAAVLDADLAVLTPGFAFGPDAPDTVIREGTSPTGAVEGDFIATVANVFNTASIFIPPGKVVTFLHVTVNTALTMTVCFVEAD